jgi:hypothetical protein
MRSWTQMTASLLLFTFGAAGCGAEGPIEEDEETDDAAQALVSSNALSTNAVVANAVVANAVVASALKKAAIGNMTDLISALNDGDGDGDGDGGSRLPHEGRLHKECD